MKIEKLPTYSNGKKQGNNAADILKKNLGKFGLVNVVDEAIDLGIDMKVQVIENNKPVPLFFNVQCKGKDELAEDNWQEGYISVPIKISTVNFWRQQNDITDKVICCVWKKIYISNDWNS